MGKLFRAGWCWGGGCLAKPGSFALLPWELPPGTVGAVPTSLWTVLWPSSPPCPTFLRRSLQKLAPGVHALPSRSGQHGGSFQQELRGRPAAPSPKLTQRGSMAPALKSCPLGLYLPFPKWASQGWDFLVPPLCPLEEW